MQPGHFSVVQPYPKGCSCISLARTGSHGHPEANHWQDSFPECEPTSAQHAAEHSGFCQPARVKRSACWVGDTCWLTAGRRGTGQVVRDDQLCRWDVEGDWEGGLTLPLNFGGNVQVTDGSVEGAHTGRPHSSNLPVSSTAEPGSRCLAPPAGQ